MAVYIVHTRGVGCNIKGCAKPMIEERTEEKWMGKRGRGEGRERTGR